MNIPTDSHQPTIEATEFHHVYLAIHELLDLPEDGDPHGQFESADDPDDTHLNLGLDLNRIASTGAALQGEPHQQAQLVSFIDPTLTFDHCLASLHGVLAHLVSLNAPELQQAKGGMFRARRLVRRIGLATPGRARTTKTNVDPALNEYRAQVHRIEDRISNIRLRTPIAAPWDKDPNETPLPPGAHAWSVMWHLCVAHSLGGPAGEAMAHEIMNPPYSPAISLRGLTDIVASLGRLDATERSEAFAAMDFAKRYFYPLPT